MTEKDLFEIEQKCNRATKGPWKSIIEGRDQTSGSSFISTSDEDIYVSNPTTNNNQDFIASAKQDIPRLIAEIRKLKNELIANR